MSKYPNNLNEPFYYKMIYVYLYWKYIDLIHVIKIPLELKKKNHSQILSCLIGILNIYVTE